MALLFNFLTLGNPLFIFLLFFPFVSNASILLDPSTKGCFFIVLADDESKIQGKEMHEDIDASKWDK